LRSSAIEIVRSSKFSGRRSCCFPPSACQCWKSRGGLAPAAPLSGVGNCDMVSKASMASCATRRANPAGRRSRRKLSRRFWKGFGADLFRIAGPGHPLDRARHGQPNCARGVGREGSGLVSSPTVLTCPPVSALVAMPDREWSECNRGKQLTQNWMARKLKPFGIQPKTVRIGGMTAMGYEIAEFSDAFERYLFLPHSIRHTVANA